VAGHGVEIERKYLLDGAPTEAELRAFGAEPIEIEQVYLAGREDAPVRRIRRSRRGGTERYHYTEKRAIGGIVRGEREREIDAEEYQRLSAEADPARRPIRKTRHVFPYDGRTMELDVFEVPPEVVLLEIELDSADDVPRLPPGLRVLREVSEEDTYQNVTLALR